ncbi:precorrin-6y C5,15-methyltransferase (decarboxylating) subunit CbiE [Aciditerrimonas ferrireducens]|uniref:precorrin-6y C5,15-methyltransferase (decarboxylating) subunit CbiE n=1 Tax=Aciditerrimonas ferrireducens TaxID=667306 RepID=UPI002005D336|nr:precorrin-6y C5,15-methyltransferase (decarboxylating) subunit CbiE [Aciditerrimonas ferrireducens]MCK4177400.1 precorrin-6y C5,15-methyltransferase (decarboxylating) subunit CbiE [Aciditerrimonas ferrireducens]
MPEPGPPQLTVVPGEAPGTVAVVGLLGDSLAGLPLETRKLVAQARLVAGGQRHLAAWRRWLGDRSAQEVGAKAVPTLALEGDLEGAVQALAHRAVEDGQDVCVLASGDPGFFGITRTLLRVLDRQRLRIVPAPSAVAVAFARLGLPWDDAVVASAHGRPLADAVRAVRLARKAAVLTSPEHPPQAVGQALVEAGLSMDLVAVCSRLGCEDERVIELDLAQLAHGRFDPLSVVVLVGPGGLQSVGWGTGPAGAAGGSLERSRTLAWGLPESAFAHRGGMVTKSEVRSVVLGKLALPAAGVLWDLGAGSGSVAVEAALVSPGLTVFAVEQDPEAAARVAENATTMAAGVHVVVGAAPEALADLPDPDRVFVGGGGIPALDAALRRLRPGGRVVATFAALDRAAQAAERLGRMVEVTVSRARRLPDGGWRLAGANPVFVAWGPADDEDAPAAEPGPSAQP